MTTTDWLIDIALILIVFRQLREARLDTRFVLVPLALVGVTAHSYLHSIPTAGNDLSLVALFVTLGAVLGTAGGLFTRVRTGGTNALVKAGAISAGLWVASMGGRMAFQLWSSNGGGPSLDRFSSDHDIASSQAWVAALVLMALTEVITRVATICYRGYLVQRAARPVGVLANPFAELTS